MSSLSVSSHLWCHEASYLVAKYADRALQICSRGDADQHSISGELVAWDLPDLDLMGSADHLHDSGGVIWPNLMRQALLEEIWPQKCRHWSDDCWHWSLCQHSWPIQSVSCSTKWNAGLYPSPESANLSITRSESSLTPAMTSSLMIFGMHRVQNRAQCASLLIKMVEPSRVARWNYCHRISSFSAPGSPSKDHVFSISRPPAW